MIDRAHDLQLRVNDLTREHEELDDEDDKKVKIIENTRKQLEREVTNLNGRILQNEDRLKMLIMKLVDQFKEKGIDLNNQSEDNGGSGLTKRTYPDVESTKEDLN